MIVCASRRTDIPAFHAEWLMNRLREGYALVRNPVAKSVVHRVDLSPRNMDLLVLMTKDPRPMLPFMEELMDMGVNLLFQVTVTPYGRDIEPGVPGKADVAEAFREVSRAIGRDRVVWRYDPVILNDRLDVGYHRRKFGAILGELGGYTDRCVVGFVEMHGKLRHLSDQGTIRGVSPEEADGIGRALSEAARGSGIELTSCCSPHDLSRHGIQPRGCIGRELMAALGVPSEEPPAPIREGCLCVRNVDLGEYDTCDHDCVYCYANCGTDVARKRRRYDPKGEMLHGRLREGDTVVEAAPRRNSRITDF